MTEGDKNARTDEIEVMQSIFGEEFRYLEKENRCDFILRPTNEEEASAAEISLEIHLPDDYPSASIPVVELNAPWLQHHDKETIWNGLKSLATENSGEVVLFLWADWIKEQDWIWKIHKKWEIENVKLVKEKGIKKAPEVINSKQMEQKESHSKVITESNAPNLENLEASLGIIHGEPFTVKKSTFQAHLAPVSSTDAVQTVLSVLRLNKRVAAATHNIMAYRFKIQEKNTWSSDCDDDGENAAGGRLLHLLSIVDAQNVVVVVSRWFGGILLGPDRFKHINNVARQLLDECGYIPQGNSKGKSKKG